MKRLMIVTLIVGAWVCLTYLDNPAYTFRYRLTIEVEASGRRHEGSSVVEITERVTKWTLHPGTLGVRANGEATVVDLGDGRVLVALLRGAIEEKWRKARTASEWTRLSPSPHLANLHGLKYDWRDGRNEGLAQLVRKRGVKELDRYELPTLLMFHDKSDPLSVTLVDPAAAFTGRSDDMRIVRASIEVTDDAISQKIEIQLPWLRTIKGSLNGAKGCRYDDALRTELSFCPQKRDFIRGD